MSHMKEAIGIHMPIYLDTYVEFHFKSPYKKKIEKNHLIKIQVVPFRV